MGPEHFESMYQGLAPWDIPGPQPAIVRLAIDPEAITPGMTLAKIRAKSLAEKKA